MREATGPLERLAIKGTRYLLLTRADNTWKWSNFRSWSGRSSSTNRSPKAGRKEETRGLLWEQHSYAAMSRFLTGWCRAGPNETGVRQLRQMAKTLQVHRRGLLNYWCHPINNGRMEGTNNKIKTLNRQAYGRTVMRSFHSSNF